MIKTLLKISSKNPKFRRKLIQKLSNFYWRTPGNVELKTTSILFKYLDELVKIGREYEPHPKLDIEYLDLAIEASVREMEKLQKFSQDKGRRFHFLLQDPIYFVDVHVGELLSQMEKSLKTMSSITLTSQFKRELEKASKNLQKFTDLNERAKGEIPIQVSFGSKALRKKL